MEQNVIRGVFNEQQIVALLNAIKKNTNAILAYIDD